MKKFLIIQTAFLGDVILATPVILELKRIYPDCQLDVLVRKGNESLLKNNPELVQRLSNVNLAAYLNISPETLSRLKSQI